MPPEDTTEGVPDEAQGDAQGDAADTGATDSHTATLTELEELGRQAFEEMGESAVPADVRTVVAGLIRAASEG